MNVFANAVVAVEKPIKLLDKDNSTSVTAIYHENGALEIAADSNPRTILLLIEKLIFDRYKIKYVTFTEKLAPEYTITVGSNKDTKTTVYVRKPNETHPIREIVEDKIKFLYNTSYIEFPYIDILKEGPVIPIISEFEKRHSKDYSLGSNSIIFFEKSLANLGRKRTINKYPLLDYRKITFDDFELGEVV